MTIGARSPRAAVRVLTNAALLFAALLVATVGTTAVAARYGDGLAYLVLFATVVLLGAAWNRAGR